MSRIEWRVDAGTHIVYRRPPFLRRKVELNGQRLQGTWRKKTFEFNLADGRAAQIELKADALSRTTELTIDGKLIPDTRYVPKDLRCPACNDEIQLLDEFCTRCGNALGTPSRFLHHKSVKGATTAILILAGLYAAFGLFVYFMLRDQANVAFGNLAQFADDDFVVGSDGATYTAGELRNQVFWAHRGMLIINLGLSALMLGLAWWSKRKPLPAILIATAIFAALQVVNAMIDPKTLMQGFIIKIIIVAVLVRGIKGAFSLRANDG